MSESKVAVVLGVGSGLGAAVARRFAIQDFSLGLMARSSEKLTLLQIEIEKNGGTALSIPADATAPASVTSAFAKVKQFL